VHKLKIFLLSGWLGAAMFFSFEVAPAVFGVLRSFNLPNANEIAGAIVTRSLSVVNVSGFMISVLLLILTLIAETKQWRPYSLLARVALVLVALGTAIGQWVIAARMRALRAAMVVIDQVAFDDPRRVAFNNLHRWSVYALSAAMLAAAAALLFTQPRRTK
jgi:Domain of unknown function (DUF4149)